MSQTIFSDGVADVVVIGGVVRIDFFTLVRDPSTKLQAQTSGNEPPPMQREQGGCRRNPNSRLFRLL